MNNITEYIENIEKKTGNIYEACIVIAKRSRQLNQVISDELREKLGNIETEEDLNEESIDRETLITEWENQEKPTSKAIREIMGNKLHYEYVLPNTEEIKKS